MIHSVPRFPDLRGNGYSYPEPQKIYGQSFICVNFKVNTFNTIAKKVDEIKPYIYHSYMPKKFEQPATRNIVELIDTFMDQSKSTIVQYDKSLIFIEAALQQKLISMHHAVNRDC